MKLQYEILSLGLKGSMIALAEEHKAKMQHESEGDRYDRSIFDDMSQQKKYGDKDKKHGLYYRFATYFVDDKNNLKDICQQLGSLSDDEERIKEELFLLLSFFILTFEKRQEAIQDAIKKNKANIVGLIQEFR